MSQLSQTQVISGARVRPSLITAIACLELAAALWDGRIFLNLNSVFPVGSDSGILFQVLMPALMCITALYAGFGLLQMRRSGWAVWMARHLFLGGLYLLALPHDMLVSVFYPAASFVVTWRVAIIIFSILSGTYLYAVKGSFTRK